MDPDRLVFVDECGTHTSMTRLYARAPKGERAYAISSRRSAASRGGADPRSPRRGHRPGAGCRHGAGRERLVCPLRLRGRGSSLVNTADESDRVH